MTQAAKEAARFLKSTLRLPKSSFPPRPPPADLAKYLPRCTDDLYAWQRQERPATDTFTLHDGPPYANGDLHVGHALNKIVKDIICRTRLAQGKRVDYVPGWDCHGLPIEIKVLERHGWKRGKGVDPVAIRNAARTFAQATVEKQMSGFRSWAVMGDWKAHWKTMDDDFEIRQLSVFRAMAKHGLIYRKHKPVYWSPSSGTALAEAELEYKDDHISTAALVKFALDVSIAGNDPVFALIWTTTPWTLPANQAIALNKNLQYSLVESRQHGKMVIARSRLQNVEQRIEEALQIIQEAVSIDDLLGSTYSGLKHFGLQCADRPIVHAEFVSAESGTGLVHCAPGHGLEDYDALQPWIEAGRVLVRAPVDDDGSFTSAATANVPSVLEGQNAFTEGNETVLRLLEEHGLLTAKHQHKHKYPIDWRTKEPVMIRATAQWFADISEIRRDALNALDRVSFLPHTGKSRLQSFVENRSEWCISRQRAWGVPIPAIYHKESGAAVLSDESIDHIMSVIAQRGIDAWWSDPVDDSAWVVSGLCAEDYRRGTDTMDVWFDSGTSWTSMQDASCTDFRPADVYIEGTDQHRGWFQSSLLTSIAHQKSTDPDRVADAPFRTLVTHGFTLDSQGKKMSKSLGNVVAPSQIITGLAATGLQASAPKSSSKQREVHSLGPDALRLWAAGSDWTTDVVISDTVVKTVHTALDKYRVTFKLLLGLLDDFDAHRTMSYPEMSHLDQLALSQLYQVSSSIQQAFANLEFHRAVSMINKWIATDLSGFYFESIKDVIYCDSSHSARRRSAQTTLYHILCQLQSMLGPLAPLLVEESFAHSSTGLAAAGEHPLRRVWSAPPSEWDDGGIQQQLPLVMAINSSVKTAQERARSAKLMGQSLASDVLLCLEAPFEAAVKLSDETWKEILVVSDFERIADRSEDVQQATKALYNRDSEDIRSHGRSTIAKAFAPDAGSSPIWSFCQEIESDGKTMGFVIVRAPDHAKCARCWKFTVPGGYKVCDDSSTGPPALPLCKRCEEVVAELRA